MAYGKGFHFRRVAVNWLNSELTDHAFPLTLWTQRPAWLSSTGKLEARSLRGCLSPKPSEALMWRHPHKLSCASSSSLRGSPLALSTLRGCLTSLCKPSGLTHSPASGWGLPAGTRQYSGMLSHGVLEAFCLEPSLGSSMPGPCPPRNSK